MENTTINSDVEKKSKAKFEHWMYEHFSDPGKMSEQEITKWFSCWLDGVSYGVEKAQEIFKK